MSDAPTTAESTLAERHHADTAASTPASRPRRSPRVSALLALVVPALVAGRGVHGLLVPVPMVLGCRYGVEVAARRGRGAPTG